MKCFVSRLLVSLGALLASSALASDTKPDKPSDPTARCASEAADLSNAIRGVVPLARDPFASTRGGSLGKKFGETLGLDLKDKEIEKKYRQMAGAFALDGSDGLLLSKNANGTTVKMNPQNGELLIVTRDGQVAFYGRLSVKDLPYFLDAPDFVKKMSEVVSMGSGSRQFASARLSAGESLGARAFIPALRKAKYEKHVVQQKEFGNRFQDAFEYERAAVAFANDTTRPSICITQVARDGVVSLQTIKFDPLSNEFVVVDRFTGEVVTYYKGNLDAANAELERKGRFRARNMFEYFLAGRDFSAYQ